MTFGIIIQIKQILHIYILLIHLLIVDKEKEYLDQYIILKVLIIKQNLLILYQVLMMTLIMKLLIFINSNNQFLLKIKLLYL